MGRHLAAIVFLVALTLVVTASASTTEQTTLDALAQIGREVLQAMDTKTRAQVTRVVLQALNKARLERAS